MFLTDLHCQYWHKSWKQRSRPRNWELCAQLRSPYWPHHAQGCGVKAESHKHQPMSICIHLGTVTYPKQQIESTLEKVNAFFISLQNILLSSGHCIKPVCRFQGDAWRWSLLYILLQVAAAVAKRCPWMVHCLKGGRKKTERKDLFVIIF